MSRRRMVMLSRSWRRRSCSAAASAASWLNSSARATSGVRSKPKASAISPPSPFRAYRFPLALSRRMMMPRATRISQVPTQSFLRHTACPLCQHPVRRKDDDRFVAGERIRPIERQERLQNGERPVREAEQRHSRADVVEDQPFAHESVWIAFIGDDLGLRLGERVRSPPKGRR